MTPARLFVRSTRARDLARELSRRERRPFQAIVEDALVEYAQKHRQQSPTGFLTQLKALAVKDVDLDGPIAANRWPHDGIDM